jgi:Fe-S-cluster containining protein
MSPCRKCSADCCKYFALQIDTPKTREDFENVRWYLAHKKTAIYYDRRKWFLEVKTACEYLTPEHMCNIYHKRPQICREHSVRDCEFTDGEFTHELYFKKLEDLDKYLTKRFGSRKNKKTARKKKKR